MLVWTALAIAAQGGASSGEWVPYMERNGDTGYLHMESVKVEREKRIAWQRVDFAATESDGSITRLYNVRFDCERHTMQLLSYAGISKDGKVMKSPDVRFPLRPVPKDSPAQTMLSMVCARSDGK